jgi:hypothetical protein
MATNTFKSNVAANIVTTGNTVYTTPAATQTTLIGLTLCNKSTSAVTATVSLTRSAVNYQIASNVSISSNTTAIIVGGAQKIVLQASDSLTISASANAAVDAVASLLEIA